MELQTIEWGLKELGLTQNETKVYLACLQSGSSLASEISRKSGVYRTIIYDVLESLISKGLASYVIRENRKYFNAASPDSLLKYFEEKERSLYAQRRKLNVLIDELKKIDVIKKEKYCVETFTGYNGFKALFEDILESKEYFLINYRATGKYLDTPYFINWSRRRIKKKVKRNLIVQERFREEIMKREEYTAARFLPDSYNIPTSLLFYGNKSILFLPLEDDFAGIRIESKKVVNSFRAYFRILWASANK